MSTDPMIHALAPAVHPTSSNDIYLTILTLLQLFKLSLDPDH